MNPHNCWGGPERVTTSHWVVKFIRILPMTGNWTEVTWRLRQLITRIQPFTPLTYWGLVDFLMVDENVLDSLGDDPIARQEAAHQLICVGLIEPSECQNLSRSIDDRVVTVHHQMRIYAHDRLKAWQCKRVAKLWARWLDTKDEIYPRGVQGTWMRVWELVKTMPGIEGASTDYIAQLLAPPLLTTPTAVVTSSTPITIATFNSKGSNSVAIVAQDDDNNDGD